MNQVILADAVYMPCRDGIYFCKTINVQEFLGVIRKSHLKDELVSHIRESEIANLIDEVLNDVLLHSINDPVINDRDAIVVMLIKSKPKKLSLSCFDYMYVYYHDGSDLEIREV